MSSNLAYSVYVHVYAWVGRAVRCDTAWAKVSCSVSSTLYGEEEVGQRNAVVEEIIF